MTPNISNEELNSHLAETTNGCFPAAKKWQRVDVGTIESYIGDNLYVVSVIEKRPKTVTEMNANCEKVKRIVIRYLESEGFIGEEYLYIGLQRLDLQNLPDGL